MTLAAVGLGADCVYVHVWLFGEFDCRFGLLACCCADMLARCGLLERSHTTTTSTVVFASSNTLHAACAIPPTDYTRTVAIISTQVLLPRILPNALYKTPLYNVFLLYFCAACENCLLLSAFWKQTRNNIAVGSTLLCPIFRVSAFIKDIRVDKREVPANLFVILIPNSVWFYWKVSVYKISR